MPNREFSWKVPVESFSENTLLNFGTYSVVEKTTAFKNDTNPV